MTLKKVGMTAEAKGAKTAYIDGNHVEKHVVWLAKSGGKWWQSLGGNEEFARVFPDVDGVSYIVKQMDCTNQDIVGGNCVTNDAGELALTDEDKVKAWVEHYARRLNVKLPPWGPPYSWPPSQCVSDPDL